jgi:hypothetical protein
VIVIVVNCHLTLAQVPLHVYAVEDHLHIDEMGVDPGDNEANEVYRQQQEQRPQAQSRAYFGERALNDLMVRLNRLEHIQHEGFSGLERHVFDLRSMAEKRFSAVSKSIQGVAIQPPHQLWHHMSQQQQNRLDGLARQAPRGGGDTAGDGEEKENDPPPTRGPRQFLLHGAVLSKRPKNLHELWHEYTHGIGGNKPAKDFTPQESGHKANKFAYCRRRPFWECMKKLINANYTAPEAIKKIYSAYGHNSSVSFILNCFKEDKSKGGHENLRV